MAGVEMEPDASHHLNFAADLDEDLITYESDVVDRHELDNDATWNQQPFESTVEADDEVPLDAGFNPEDDDNKDANELLSQEPKNGNVHASPSVDNDQEPHIGSAHDEALAMEDERERQNANAEEGQNEHNPTDPKDGETEQIDFFSAGDQDAELLGEVINTNILSGEEVEGGTEGNNDSDHEIDYDHNELEGSNFINNGEALDPADDGGSGQGSTAAHHTSTAKDQFSDTQDPATVDTLGGENEEEITWEEGEGNTTHVNNTTDENLPEDHETTNMSHDVKVGNDEGEGSEGVEYMDEDGNENEHSEDGTDQTYPAGTDVVSGDASAASPGHQQDHASVHSDSEHPDFPSITVQYKGDEFPFFSGSADGFFTESAVLDDDMKSLMAGFRAELANEIATDEELIFQIDELGLEFSESSMNEALSGITLRQILEVFDLLVKNQDPDSSRVLYTYLFTRPSTSKRFESLVESATAGKGLDEVIHLFASPMPHGNRVVMEATLAGDNHENDLDVYESAEDMQEAEHADIEEHDGVEEDDGAKEHDAEQVTEELDTISHEEHHSQTDQDDQDGSHTNPRTPTPATRQQIETAETDPADADSESIQTHTLSKHDANKLDDSLPETQHHEENEPAGYHDAHSAGVDAAADVGFLEAGLAQEATVETSTTDTLDDIDDIDDIAEAEPEMLVADVDVDFTADHEFPQDSLDELAEIDWRHEADDPDAPGDTALGAGKRPRTDDELGVDDDKDAKRLRS